MGTPHSFTIATVVDAGLWMLTQLRQFFWKCG
jgi:hypothetical protein